jgi:hypothetical protein
MDDHWRCHPSAKLIERNTNMTMKMKLFSSRFVLTVAAGLAACGLQAQSISATGTLSETPGTGGNFDYTLTVANTGSIPIEGVWYGWTTSGNNLPSTPTVPASTSGWAAALFSSTSIQYQGNATDAIAAGKSETFTFDSTSTLTQLTTGTVGGVATGESVVYAGTIGFTGNSPGVSEVFTPTAVPEPSSLGLFAFGSFSLLAGGWRKLRR